MERKGGRHPVSPIYVHSDYSLLQSALSVEQLVKRARELSIEMLALTDYNTTAGHYELQRYCQAAGIKPIFGLELDVEYSGGGAGAYCTYRPNKRGLSKHTALSIAARTRAPGGPGAV